MSKTPEQMAEEWMNEEYGDTSHWVRMGKDMSIDAYLAGYQAAKNSPEKPDPWVRQFCVFCNDWHDGNCPPNRGRNFVKWNTNLPTPAKWISVKDRLPEDGMEVLFYSPEKEINCCFVGYRATENEYVDPEGNGLIARQIEKYYTHWMPLPKPPEE